MSTTKPHVVAIPGAWHSHAAFAEVTKRLEAAGYTVHSRQMPSVGNSNPPEDLSQDIEATRELVLKAIGDGNDVIVVPHSWSGIVVGSALVGLGKKQREAKGEKGGVVRGAYICSFIVPEGVSLMDCLQHKIPGWWDIKGPHTFAIDPLIFYNDLPASEQQYWMSQLQSMAFATKKAKATAASWKEIPTSYLLCEDDRAIPAAAQEQMANGVREMGGEIEVERINTSHSPFLSQPDVVVEWIRRVAGEKL